MGFFLFRSSFKNEASGQLERQRLYGDVITVVYDVAMNTNGCMKCENSVNYTQLSSNENDNN